jgi:Helix-turn-helix family
MGTASLIAPEIDRIVLGVNAAIGSRYGDEVGAAAASIGLEAPGPLIQFADFILGGALTVALRDTRFPYMAPGTIEAFFADLESRGKLALDDGAYEPDAATRAMLETLIRLRGSVAHELWSDIHDIVDSALELSSPARDVITDHFLVASAHRALPEPEEECLRLHHRLTTLRYVRTQAHIDAWRERHMTPQQIVAMTRLWHGEQSDDRPALLALSERGWVDEDLAKLAPSGLAEREAIEADTNAGVEPVFDALGDAGSRLVATLLLVPVPE